MAKMDKNTAEKMWLEGKSDKEIAEHFGVSVQYVHKMRRTVWEAGEGQVRVGEPETETSLPQSPVATVPATEENGVAGHHTAEAAKDDGRFDLDVQEDEAKAMFRTLELMTSHLKGMDAVMTAQIVTTLWDWKDKEDLLEARNCLDYLIGRAK